MTVVASSDNGSATFKVHKDVLVQHSPFAAAKLSENWTRDNDFIVTLEETSPAAAEAFLKWLYTKKVFSSDGDGDNSAEWDFLVELYLLGDFLQSLAFCNDVMTAFCGTIDLGDDWWPCSLASRVYSHTSSRSPLRKLLVDCHIYHSQGEDSGTDLAAGRWQSESLKVEFLSDMFVELFEWKTSDYNTRDIFQPRFPDFSGEWIDRYLVDVSKVTTEPGKTR